MKLRQSLLPASIAALLVVGDGVLAGADNRPTTPIDQHSRQERLHARGTGPIGTLNSDNVAALRSLSDNPINAR
jgi:hypothetical protein